MWEAKGKVAIVGVGFSKLTRNLEGTLGARCVEASINAVKDAGLKLSDIDGFATMPEGRGVDGIDGVSVEYMMQHLDVAPEIQWYSSLDTGLPPSAVIEAINALGVGACKYALVWLAMHQPRGIYGAVSTNLATGAAQFQTPYGFGSAFQPHALAYQRYMERFGMKREHMATLAVTQRAYANKNEKAFFYKTPMSREDYMNARMISDPMCLFDCDIPVVGAAAVVLTTAERARHLKNPPAYIAGYGHNTNRRPTLIAYTMVDYMESGGSIAKKIFDRSGLGAKDVDVVEVYDGFSPSVLYWLESAGFCKEGEAFQFIQDGRIEQDGQLPVNTHGGALSEGRTHAMGHIAEAVAQVTGRAGPRQVKDCHVAYVTAGSPMLRGAGLLITSQP